MALERRVVIAIVRQQVSFPVVKSTGCHVPLYEDISCAFEYGGMYFLLPQNGSYPADSGCSGWQHFGWKQLNTVQIPFVVGSLAGGTRPWRRQDYLGSFSVYLCCALRLVRTIPLVEFGPEDFWIFPHISTCTTVVSYHMARIKAGRDSKPSKQLLLAPPKKPSAHGAGSAIVDFSLQWATTLLKLDDDKKAYARAKQGCRETWDLTSPVEGASMEERRRLSKKRFKKEVWPFVMWATKRILHLKDNHGLYAPASKVDAIAHWEASAAAAAARPRPRPVPVGRLRRALLAAPPLLGNADAVNDDAAKDHYSGGESDHQGTPATQPARTQMLRSPIVLVRPPARRYRVTPYPRKKRRAHIKQEASPPQTHNSRPLTRIKKESASPDWLMGSMRIKKESTSPESLMRLMRIKKEPTSPDALVGPASPAISDSSTDDDAYFSAQESPIPSSETMPTSPGASSYIADTPPRPCQGRPFRRLFGIESDVEDVPLRSAQVSPVRGGTPALPAWDLDDEDYAYNDCDMFGG
ncbi:hypothetical protein CYLTODRAFT_460274 [Cylindrobasidium torrendii FP15055 ss-10]|uniref:Uncharacterized protein n=1 Tax=Cylindrobasidium torrendii FP15055 ss-10 TaxID=1314674 RepID=A0A0D7ARG5_9AGAR|nr:hypothetical protein CYLTODRAFT_460274 [Cylindrobasidium torrendii FP15055 ss-10]